MNPTVSCPQCNREVTWSKASPWRPFCSQRCRLIDLGEWFNEENRLENDTASDPDTARVWGESD
ncbi:MAG: DNA gyrase inhibitor YacG [Pseudomonadota bacterium]